MRNAPTRASQRATTRATTGATALVTAVAAVSTLLTTAPHARAAEANGPGRGTTSLFPALDPDTRFDRDPRDHDVLGDLVRLVLKERPESPLAVLTQGERRLTFFAPTDAAFGARRVPPGEPSRELETAAFLGGYYDIGQLEELLLNHVVLGKALGSRRLLAADGAQLTSATGETLVVDVTADDAVRVAFPRYRDRGRLVDLDVNRGNRQVAHSINDTLVPDLGS